MARFNPFGMPQGYDQAANPFGRPSSFQQWRSSYPTAPGDRTTEAVQRALRGDVGAPARVPITPPPAGAPSPLADPTNLSRFATGTLPVNPLIDPTQPGRMRSQAIQGGLMQGAVTGAPEAFGIRPQVRDRDAGTPDVQGGGGTAGDTSPTYQQAESLIQQWYKEFLGRGASPEEVNSHLRNLGYRFDGRPITGLDFLRDEIKNSQEAKDYTKGKAGGGTTGGGETDKGPPPGATGKITPAPSGWDPTKWADPKHTSVKYTAGRILAKYPATTAGLASAFTEIKKAFPKATFDGKDSIDFGDGYGPIDVLQGASQGGVAWQWLPASQAGPPPAQAGGAPAARREGEAALTTDADRRRREGERGSPTSQRDQAMAFLWDYINSPAFWASLRR